MSNAFAMEHANTFFDFLFRHQRSSQEKNPAEEDSDEETS